MSASTVAILISSGSLLVSVVTVSFNVATYRRGRHKVFIKTQRLYNYDKENVFELTLYNRGLSNVRVREIRIWTKPNPFSYPTAILDGDLKETLKALDYLEFNVVVSSSSLIKPGEHVIQFIAHLSDGRTAHSKRKKEIFFATADPH